MDAWRRHTRVTIMAATNWSGLINRLVLTTGMKSFFDVFSWSCNTRSGQVMQGFAY